jgi:uncharacterized membrane protein
MGPRASSAWRGVRRLCGMHKFTTNPSCGWDVNKTEVLCWEIATLSTPFRGLVPLVRRNLVPILPPAHPYEGVSLYWTHPSDILYTIILLTEWKFCYILGVQALVPCQTVSTTLTRRIAKYWKIKKIKGYSMVETLQYSWALFGIYGPLVFINCGRLEPPKYNKIFIQWEGLWCIKYQKDGSNIS